MSDSRTSNVLFSEAVLSILIAVLSVLTAFAAYRSAAVDSTSGDNYFLAQQHQIESNFQSIFEASVIELDYELAHTYALYTDADPEFADKAYELMSVAAQEAFDFET